MRNTLMAGALGLLLVLGAGAAFGQNEDTSLSSGESQNTQGFGYGNLFGGGKTALGGYASLRFTSFDDEDSNFALKRFVIAVRSEISDSLTMESEIEFEPEDGKVETEIEYIHLDYRFSPGFTFRGGIILIPFGNYNIYHSDPEQYLVEDPLPNRLIVPRVWRDAGAGFFGDFYSGDAKWSYAVYALNGLQSDTKAGSENITETGGVRKARTSGVKDDNNGNKALMAHLAYSPSLGFEIGASGYTGDYDEAGDNAITILGANVYYTRGPLELLGEWDTASLVAATPEIPEDLAGYYVEGRYHFGRPHKEGNPRPYSVILRVEQLSISDTASDKNSTDSEEDRTTFGINFRPNVNTAFKLEYQNNEGDLVHKDSNGWLFSVAYGW
ncbi:MAG: hypothetical protein ACREJQ_08225 [bacterium]